MVASSVAKRAALRTGVRELLVRLCAVLGSMAGLLWGLGQRSGATAACERATANEVTRCTSETIVATALPYVAGVFGGLVLGAVVGLALAQLFVPSRRPLHARPSGNCQLSGVSGRWITARYAGSCVGCRAVIAVGDRVLFRPHRTVCDSCAAEPPGPRG